MALTPEYLAEVPKSLIDTYQKLEDFIIEDIARRIAKAGTITDTAKWQAERANEFGIAIETIKKEIAKINKMSYAEVDKLFKDAAITSIENDNVLYEQAKLTPMHYSEIPGLNDYLISAVKQTKGELRNISQSLGFIISTPTGAKAKKLTAVYQDVLDLVQMQVSSGVIDYNTAVRNAVKDLARSGIRRIDYESGWHNRVDVAVKRATLTGVNQMSRHLTDIYHDKMVDKNDQYVEVTAHSGARPDHAEWQGKVYKVVGSSRRYPNLAEATGLGTGKGLMGWNCRHSYFPFIPDISIRTYTDEQLENIDPEPFEYKGLKYTYYEATQKQRQLETRIRATKRELIAYDAIDDKDAFYKASLQLKNQQEAYKEFSITAGIREKKDRTQVLGYDRSISQKSVWSIKKNKKD